MQRFSKKTSTSKLYYQNNCQKNISLEKHAIELKKLVGVSSSKEETEQKVKHLDHNEYFDEEEEVN
jgi:ABC-type multidrug transport system ATPase subunit